MEANLPYTPPPSPTAGLRNNTAAELLAQAIRQVTIVYADLPTDHPGERRLAGALHALKGVAGHEVDGPFGPYVPEGHIGPLPDDEPAPRPAPADEDERETYVCVDCGDYRTVGTVCGCSQGAE